MTSFTLLNGLGSQPTLTDDTHICHAHSNPVEIEHAINADLALIDKWYDQNGLRRNSSN